MSKMSSNIPNYSSSHTDYFIIHCALDWRDRGSLRTRCQITRLCTYINYIIKHLWYLHSVLSYKLLFQSERKNTVNPKIINRSISVNFSLIHFVDIPNDSSRKYSCRPREMSLLWLLWLFLFSNFKRSYGFLDFLRSGLHNYDAPQQKVQCCGGTCFSFHSETVKSNILNLLSDFGPTMLR